MRIFASSFMVFVVCGVISIEMFAQEGRTAEFFAAFDLDGDGEVTKTEIYSPAAAADLVVGPKGSPVQLTLSTLYYRSKPIETIPYHVYQDLIVSENEDGSTAAGGNSENVEFAIPICLGDWCNGFRVVATTEDYLEKVPIVAGRDGTRENFVFREGRGFTDDEYFSAVIGCKVANQLGLKVGDEIRTHHSVGQPLTMHEDAFTVVGIIAPSSSPADNVVFINLEGFYLQEDHALPMEGDPNDRERLNRDGKGNLIPLPIEQRELSGLLIATKDSEDDFNMSNVFLEMKINRLGVVQAVNPTEVIASVMERTDDIALLYSLRNAVLENGSSVSKKGFEKQVVAPEK